jgi:hypothetical protein
LKLDLTHASGVTLLGAHQNLGPASQRAESRTGRIDQDPVEVLPDVSDADRPIDGTEAHPLRIQA